jgi:Cell division protein FtsI/penicillin-binding protein 2
MAMDFKKCLKLRLVSVMIFFLVLFIALLSRAFQLQVLSGEKLKNLAQRQHTAILQLQPERGMIYDRNGEKLAVSVLADSVCADPTRIADPVRASQQIAGILNLDKQVVMKKILEPKNFCGWLEESLRIRQPMWIMRKLKEYFWSKSLSDFILTGNWPRICLDLPEPTLMGWKDWKINMTIF